MTGRHHRDGPVPGARYVYVYDDDDDATVCFCDLQCAPSPSISISTSFPHILFSLLPLSHTRTHHVLNCKPSWDWWYSMTPCHILDRYLGPKGDPVYTVSLLFKNDPHIWESYDPTHANRDQWYIDTDVPRRAIRFIEKPYRDDEHLPGAFRHPMRFPDELVPPLWLDDDNDSQTE